MIDVHAHYRPWPLVERLQTGGARYGVSVVETEPACHALHFAYGLRLRPFFAKLIEEPAQRLASMAATGIDREILSTWTDMHAHALGVEQGVAWHRLLNESLAEFAQRHGGHFSVLASGYLPHAARAARELEDAVKQRGAPGAAAAPNVEGTDIAATSRRSAYLGRMSYDAIRHGSHALRCLAGRVGVERLVIGSDDSFPPADRDPLASLRAAGFSAAEIHRIGEATPRRLFRPP